MFAVLFVTSLILIFWVTKLNGEVKELRGINQYNFEVYQKKFADIEDAFRFEKEQRDHLLERIHDMERDQNKYIE
ncbi:hypothetical protein ACLIL3_014105 [Acinetobacter radioresistens]|uniref:hypothetical protein n=1 Tax=Acinetobacter radioresistens TaxID=40216 RepID=UPI00398541AB